MEEFALKDAIDSHFHAGPDVRERKLTYLEAAIQARDAGMKAIPIKSHSTITADIASLIQPLITHPDHLFINMSVEVQKELAQEGVFFDRCFPTEKTSPLRMEEMAKRIREVGVMSSIVTSDFGQPENPSPVEGIKIYIQQLIQLGYSNREINQMVRINPGRLLNLL